MTLNLFNQFSPPSLMHLSLLIPAIAAPWLLYLTPSNRWLNNRTTTIQEWLIKEFTKEIFTPMPTKSHKWTVILISIMVFLLTTNLLGLLPYTFTPTTQLSLNLGLAMPLWLATVTTGMRNQMSTSFAHFLPEGTPTPLIPALILIETVSMFIQPVALGVRLTANLTAGHLLIQLISTTMFSINSAASYLLIFPLLLLFTSLEIAIAVIQAYVFSLLLSLYLQEATPST